MTIRERFNRYLVKRNLRHWSREVLETEQAIGRLQAYLVRALQQRDAARSAVVWLDVPGHLHPQRASGRVDRAPWFNSDGAAAQYPQRTPEQAARAPFAWEGYDPAASRVAGPGAGDDR